MKLPEPAQKTSAGPEAAALQSESPLIIWREVGSAYQPSPLKLSEFLAGIQLGSHNPPTFHPERMLLVLIEHGCMQAMEAHARSDVLNEQAGILCGHAHIESTGQHYVNVVSALPVSTVNDAVHFRFHPGSWETVWPRMPDGSNIIGWYHTHPGMGVFLSATDLRTQRLHFSAPWQIAVVLDPLIGQIGVFRGAEGTQVSQEEWLQYLAGGLET